MMSRRRSEDFERAPPTDEKWAESRGESEKGSSQARTKKRAKLPLDFIFVKSFLHKSCSARQDASNDVLFLMHS